MAVRANWTGWLLTGGICAWVLALALATAAAASGTPGSLAFSATAAVYAVASLLCHQRPERSFHVLSTQLPVCARCAGLYLGAAIAACVAVGHHSRAVRSTLSASQSRTIFLVAAVPTLLTLAVEWTTRTAASNVWRAMAGLPLGAAIAWILVTTGRLEYQSK